MRKWIVQFDSRVEKELRKLDPGIQRKILSYLTDRVQGSSNPRVLGKQLTGPLKDFWRYRVGDYRILCKIKDQEITILVVRIAHRKEVYKDLH